MATFGPYSTTYSLVRYRIVTSETVDTINNSSKVTVSGQIYVDNSSGTWTMYNTKMTITANGSSYAATRSSAVPRNSWTTIVSKSITVPHNTDGTKSISVSGKVNSGHYGSSASSTTDGASVSSGTNGGTLKLTAIDRRSTIAISNAVIGRTATLTISSVDASFYSTFGYSLDGTTYTDIGEGYAGTYNWTLPVEFANAIPTTQTGNAYLRVFTYSSAEKTTMIGSSALVATFEFALAEDAIPIVSSVDVVPVNDNSFIASVSPAIFVQNYSKGRVIASASPSVGSSMSMYSCTGSFAFELASQALSLDYTTSDKVAAAGSALVTLVATDARGKRSAPVQKQFAVQPYTVPSVMLVAQRGLYRSGSWQPDDGGAHLRIEAKNTLSLTSFGNIATATTYKLKDTNGEEIAPVGIDGFIRYYETVAEQSYNLDYAMHDSVGNAVSKSIAIPTVSVAINIAFNLGAGGNSTGIAFGGVAEKANTVEIKNGMNLEVAGDATATNINATGNVNATTISTGALDATGSASVGGDLDVDGQIRMGGVPIGGNSIECQIGTYYNETGSLIPSGKTYGDFSVSFAEPFSSDSVKIICQGRSSTTTIGNVPIVAIVSKDRNGFTARAWRDINTTSGNANPAIDWIAILKT